MKIYLICPVRLANEEVQEQLAKYVEELESKGNEVYYPKRDAEAKMKTLKGQQLGDYAVNDANREAIRWCDEVHIWYMSESQGIHFDMGMAFMADKPLIIVANICTLDPYLKHYPKMIAEWKEKDYRGEF